ncbi:MAG: tetraacyldisaccharide 4'-kinase [Chitinophagaceae bacterium]|nr:tetraacyldisaccharide 4'-kinase [Chitinophagaceae bacterium]
MPFSLLYWLVISVRSFLYNKRIWKSTQFGMPIICIGNLSVGGTGKSPMVEYLVRQLQPHFKAATLSRGYKRKTKGYSLANDQTTALEIGDEPMQFHLKFPDLPVAVGEDRIEAVAQLLHDRPETEVIILDDAFQHRAVQAGLNIVLTDYNNLYTNDFYLPAGDLRDLKSSAKRANWIVVTKCPPDLSFAEKERVTRELNLQPGQELFFASMAYDVPYHLLTGEQKKLDPADEILLITGIANPAPLKEYLEKYIGGYHLQAYSDHHIFTIDDLRDILKKYDGLEGKQKIMLTTEKDAVRLTKFRNELSDRSFYVLPVRHEILFDQAERFNNLLIDFVRNFRAEVKK